MLVMPGPVLPPVCLDQSILGTTFFSAIAKLPDSLVSSDYIKMGSNFKLLTVDYGC